MRMSARCIAGVWACLCSGVMTSIEAAAAATVEEVSAPTPAAPAQADPGTSQPEQSGETAGGGAESSGAWGIRWSGKVSLFSGLYDIESTTTTSNDFDPEIREDFDTDTGYYGGGAAIRASAGKYAGELLLEYSDIDTFAVTETMLRLSRKIYDRTTVVVGYRLAFQGDGFANDDVYKESGFLVGLALGPFGLPVPLKGQAPTIGLALAYNGSKIDLDKGRNPNADGLVVSIPIGIPGLPWGLVFRYRRFEYDVTGSEGAVKTKEDVTEQYLTALLEYRFE